MTDWTEKWQATLARCIEAERALRVSLQSADALVAGGGHSSYNVLRTSHEAPGAVVATSMLEGMLRMAQETYSPAGGTVELEEAEIWRVVSGGGAVDGDSRVASAREQLVAWLCTGELSIAQLWAASTTVATGEQTQRKALEETANQLISAFRETLGEASIRRVKGRPVLQMYISTEQPYSGSGRKLSYHSIESTRRVAHALDAMLSWAGLEQVVCNGLITSFDHRNAFESRTRVEFPGITTVAFYNKIEFHLDEVIAGQLSRFLGEFGAERMQQLQASTAEIKRARAG